MDKTDMALEFIECHPLKKAASDSHTLEIMDLSRTLSLYRDNSGPILSATPTEAIQLMTPQFQRKNTKWDDGMKKRFIEAMLAGVQSPIKLYSAAEDGGFMSVTYILDGLQRLTAIAEFCEDRFAIFDGIYYSEIRHRKVLGNCRISLLIYHFDTHSAACQHYIDINRDITHSPEDLLVAERFLEQNTIN